jgi:HEPN domain-containing protein
MIADKTQLFNVWLKSAMIHLDMADAGFERKYPDQVFFNCQQA